MGQPAIVCDCFHIWAAPRHSPDPAASAFLLLSKKNFAHDFVGNFEKTVQLVTQMRNFVSANAVSIFLCHSVCSGKICQTPMLQPSAAKFFDKIVTTSHFLPIQKSPLKIFDPLLLCSKFFAHNYADRKLTDKTMCCRIVHLKKFGSLFT